MTARVAHRRAASAHQPRRPRRIGEIDEFDLIDRLTRRLPPPRRNSPFGPGDDAAVVATGRSTLLTTDTLVDGVHFRRDWSTPGEVGFRALEVNLSDIAAMGGVPTWALVSLVLPPELEVDAIERLYDGLARSARRARVGIVGGNITRGAQLSIAVMLLGRPDATAGRVLTRAGARPGDLIVVTGYPGLAATGRRLLEESGAGPDLWTTTRSGTSPGGAAAAGFALADPVAAAALERYLLPEARLVAAVRAARAGASAAIDISDSLAADLHHLCAASGCGASLDAALLPRHAGFDEICITRGWHADEQILFGGDDYELLFTISPRRWAAWTRGRRAAAGRGVPLTIIGTIGPRGGSVARQRAGSVALQRAGSVTRQRAGSVLLQRDGASRPLPARGWRHFA